METARYLAISFILLNWDRDLFVLTFFYQKNDKVFVLIMAQIKQNISLILKLFIPPTHYEGHTIINCVKIPNYSWSSAISANNCSTASEPNLHQRRCQPWYFSRRAAVAMTSRLLHPCSWPSRANRAYLLQLTERCAVLQHAACNSICNPRLVSVLTACHHVSTVLLLLLFFIVELPGSVIFLR